MVALIAAMTLLTVMAPVRRPKRILGAAAFLLSSSFLERGFSSLGFASLSSAARITPKSFRVPYAPLPEFTPLPWVDDLEGKEALQHASVASVLDKTAYTLEEFDKLLVEDMSIQELHRYNTALVDLIGEMKDKISERESAVLRNAMEVESETQVLWLESMMQTIGDLRGQLRRVRDRERKLQGSLAKKNGDFLQTLIRAAAAGFGGQKAAPKSDYPASGVASYMM